MLQRNDFYRSRIYRLICATTMSLTVGVPVWLSTHHIGATAVVAGIAAGISMAVNIVMTYLTKV